MKEIWKPIPGTRGRYLASNMGRVKSLWNGNKNKREKILKPFILTKKVPYHSVEIKNKTIRVSRLVLLAFIGKPPTNYCAAHLNGKSLDNRLSNLKWCSLKENQHHMIAHGTRMHGEKHWRAQLTWKDVKEIRHLRKSGVMTKQISEMYGVSRSMIRKIVSGRHWRSLTGEG